MSSSAAASSAAKNSLYNLLVLPKKNRLFRHDFLIAKSQGKSHRFPHFSIIIYQHLIVPPPRLGGGIPLQREGGGTRFSVVTSAKLDKRAVVRNRLRRLIYNSLNTEHRTPNTDIIIFPNKSTLALSPAQLRTELTSALNNVTM
ncbi:MAG: hypothetical protein G01um101416_1105 [Microgenomates group bacterium Gr01-1014_16]|nr:MAG: hypothetical protein G01um101416_1105 [Microgenomates group bacterium Gr01-1014_16]